MYKTILNKLDIESGTRIQFAIFKSCLSILMDLLGESSIDDLISLHLPILKIFENFDVEEKDFITNFVLEKSLSKKKSRRKNEKNLPHILLMIKDWT